MKTKRTMASILASAMAASMLTISPVFAAGDVSIIAEKVEAKVGETFTLQVSLKDVPAAGLSGCEFSLSYDSSIVTVTDVVAGAATDTGADANSTAISAEAPSFFCNYETEGVVDVTWTTGLTDSAYWITKDGVFLTVTGTVKDTAKAGDVSKFTINPIGRETYPGSDAIIQDILLLNMKDGEATYYSAAVTDGSVTVVDDSVTTPVVTTTISSETTTSGTGEKPGAYYGDVNLDGKVDLLDVIVVNKALAKIMDLSDTAMANADVNANGSLDDADSSILMNYTLLVIKKLPVTE